MVDNNPLVVGAAGILIISATLAPLFPMFMSMSLLSCAAFYMGTSQKQSSARPETMMYVTKPSYVPHITPFIHPLYTFIAVHTPMYTRYTCIYTIYTHTTPLTTPYTPYTP